MTTVSPYLNFDGNTREVMTFYKECFGGELVLQVVAGSPMEKHVPAELKNQIMHSTLTNGPMTIMASDMLGTSALIKGNNMRMCLHCTSEEEINAIFNKLAAGGKVNMALDKTFWGSIYGELTDKFGTLWMLNHELKK